MANRRSFIKHLFAGGLSLAVKLCVFFPRLARSAWPEYAFVSKTMNDAIVILFGKSEITRSPDIYLKIPEVAEDGAIVPLTITSTIERIDKLAVLVENNPVPLIVDAELAPQPETFFSTRIRMAKTDYVTVIVRAKGKVLSARKKVKVTVGGC